MTQNEYHDQYSPSRLRHKLRRYAKIAGLQVVEKSLQLYYAAQSPHTPVWAKATIYSALGYFISPLDAVPDFTPLAGFTDDLGVLVAAVATVAAHITPDIRDRARCKVQGWFPAAAAENTPAPGQTIEGEVQN